MTDVHTMHPWPENDDLNLHAEVPEDAGLRGGVEYEPLHLAQRLLLDRLASSALPADAARDVIARLGELAEIAEAHQVSEAERIDGWRPDLPGRGNALFPPYFIDDEQDCSLSGRVTFTRFFLGGNGVAHGGTQPLLFDEVLGRVANRGLPGVARTAFLKVNYRRVTPIDVELHFEATIDSTDGRKRWGSGRLYDADGALLSDAEALFLQLLPGQA